MKVLLFRPIFLVETTKAAVLQFTYKQKLDSYSIAACFGSPRLGTGPRSLYTLALPGTGGRLSAEGSKT